MFKMLPAKLKGRSQETGAVRLGDPGMATHSFVLSSIAGLGMVTSWSGTDPVVEVMNKAAPVVGSILIGVIPLMVAIGLLTHAWPEVAPKQPSQNDAVK